MELHELRKLRGKLNRFVAKFDDCIGTRPSCRHFRTYINGQLGPLRRKNVETIALASGTHVRTLQHFLSLHGWDERAVGRRVRGLVRSRHADENAIGVIDETSYAKKGDKTAGVKRQYCGATGKTDNCVVSVHLGYAAGDFHAMLDGDLYLPRDWAEDHERRQEAGIPPTVSYRPKWKIALDLLRRSLEEGVPMRWLTADEAYGRCSEFREAVAGFGLTYVVEIPTDLTGWTRIPEVLPSGTVVPSGRRLRKPRVAENQAKARPVKDLWRRGGPSWDFYRIKDSDKGPVVWEVRESRFYPNRNGVPGCEARLLVARNLLDDEIKYFLSNADMAVPLEALLHVAFSRCHIEQIFREGKGTVGMDEFQVRNYLPLQRHLAMTLVSLLFLAEQTAVLRGEKSPLEPLPSPRGDRSPTGTDDVAA